MQENDDKDEYPVRGRNSYTYKKVHLKARKDTFIRKLKIGNWPEETAFRHINTTDSTNTKHYMTFLTLLITS